MAQAAVTIFIPEPGVYMPDTTLSRNTPSYFSFVIRSEGLFLIS